MHALIKALVVASLLGAGFAVHHHWLSVPQDAKKQDAGGMPPGPPPTEDHKWLAMGAGKWKASGKIHMGPDQTMPMEGVQTNTMQAGGLWQLIDYKENAGRAQDAPRESRMPGYFGQVLTRLRRGHPASPGLSC